MKFAKVVFTLAGVWGIVVLTPLFFLVDVSGRQYLPPASYPHFFYGFLSLAMAWQVAFLLIGRNPVKYRVFMIPSLIEKFGFVAIVAVLYGRGRIPAEDAMVAVPDAVLGVLFVAALMKTPRAESPRR
jgi:hypothetical protein